MQVQDLTAQKWWKAVRGKKSQGRPGAEDPPTKAPRIEPGAASKRPRAGDPPGHGIAGSGGDLPVPKKLPARLVTYKGKASASDAWANYSGPWGASVPGGCAIQ